MVVRASRPPVKPIPRALSNPSSPDAIAQRRARFVQAGATDRWGPDLRAAAADAAIRAGVEASGWGPLAALELTETWLRLPQGAAAAVGASSPVLSLLSRLGELTLRDLIVADAVELVPVDVRLLWVGRAGSETGLARWVTRGLRPSLVVMETSVPPMPDTIFRAGPDLAPDAGSLTLLEVS